MKPVKFKQANRELAKPDSMSENECGSLWVYSDNTQCVSCWKLSFKERLKVLFYGTIWLGILSGRTQSPVWLDCQKTVFKDEEN